MKNAGAENNFGTALNKKEAKDKSEVSKTKAVATPKE
jgi:hypothetical protein